MNIIKRSFLGLALGALAFSCADPDLGPIFTFETLGKGGYPRLVSVTNQEFDLNNLATTAFEYEVEFVTVDKGANVASYDVYVIYNDSDEDNRVLHESYTQSDFTTTTEGFKSIAISLPLSDVLATLGVASGGLVGGDYVIFDTEVVLTDGSVFNQRNSTSAVNGSAFQGYFRNRINITCPLSDSDFVGAYAITYDDPAEGDGCYGGIYADAEVVLSLVANSTTKRSLDAPGGGNHNWYFGFTFGDGGEVEFVCDLAYLSKDIDTGVGCGGGSIYAEGNGNGTFTFSDDTTFRVPVKEYDGGCGCAVKVFDVVFTKI